MKWEKWKKVPFELAHQIMIADLFYISHRDQFKFWSVLLEELEYAENTKHYFEDDMSRPQPFVIRRCVLPKDSHEYVNVARYDTEYANDEIVNLVIDVVVRENHFVQEGLLLIFGLKYSIVKMVRFTCFY